MLSEDSDQIAWMTAGLRLIWRNCTKERGLLLRLYYNCVVITKTRLFKYTEIFTTKNENFQIKNSDIFLISAQNIDCGYSLEPPHRGSSNDYPQSMF